MLRVRVGTTLEKEMYAVAKAYAKAQGFRGANEVIEKALYKYFYELDYQVWEQPQQGGWLKRITVFNKTAVIESIRYVKHIPRRKPEVYSEEWFEERGFNRIR